MRFRWNDYKYFNDINIALAKLRSSRKLTWNELQIKINILLVTNLFIIFTWYYDIIFSKLPCVQDQEIVILFNQTQSYSPSSNHNKQNGTRSLLKYISMFFSFIVRWCLDKAETTAAINIYKIRMLEIWIHKHRFAPHEAYMYNVFAMLWTGSCSKWRTSKF